MRYAKTWFQQFRGLMFDDTPNAEIEFEFTQPTKYGASIHTCFMKYPIHVQWLNRDRQVLEEVTLKPWCLNYTPKHPAKYLIERRIKNA